MGEIVFFRTNSNNEGNTSIIIPSMYEQHWQNSFNDLKLLFDINKIYENKGFPNVMTTEFIIKNDSENEKLNLTVEDNRITILDVILNSNESQKYILGISSNIKVFIKGEFTASLYIGTY